MTQNDSDRYQILLWCLADAVWGFVAVQIFHSLLLFSSLYDWPRSQHTPWKIILLNLTSTANILYSLEVIWYSDVMYCDSDYHGRRNFLCRRGVALPDRLGLCWLRQRVWNRESDMNKNVGSWKRGRTGKAGTVTLESASPPEPVLIKHDNMIQHILSICIMTYLYTVTLFSLVVVY